MNAIFRVVARVVFAVVFAVGWVISELGGLLDWISWWMARYNYHLNETFELGLDVPDPSMLAMVVVELEEDDDEEDYEDE